MPTTAGANDYGSCSRRLLNAGIATDEAATACARALHPDRVASCVVGITAATALAPDDVLSACSRDRRPQETASCVTDIHRELGLAESKRVLETCSLSLLPLSYSDCVVGLSRTIELATEESLGYCISAGYQPENVAPTFIFAR
ncbi:hypothetical protein C7271_11040 [filamentous cyanobacterium CCP5]|nr:hypothetical protein C7271_11040 [filamentous cyanobacterium CCP5]